jgi:cytochrome c-type biogenesis protein CcmH
MNAALVSVMLLAADPGGDLEARARAIEAKLMAPCCMANTLAVHESGIAHTMRGEIRTWLDEGRDERQILDAYVARYGEQILALPRARGFNLAAYLLPSALIAVAAALLARSLGRWRRGSAPGPGPPQPAPDAADLERIERALRALD